MLIRVNNEREILKIQEIREEMIEEEPPELWERLTTTCLIVILPLRVLVGEKKRKKEKCEFVAGGSRGRSKSGKI